MVSGMITHDFLKRSNFAFEGEAAKVMKIPVSDVATSKSSVCSVGLPSYVVVDFPNRFMKGTAYETTVRLYRLTNNLTCFNNSKGADLIVAIFLLFAKDQTGLDREIFQQCAHLRSCLLPYETYCKAMLPYFAEDTSSRKDLKEIYQMQTMQRIHSSFLNEKAAEDLFGITYSLNADCTKFSPSFLIKATCDFIIGLKLPHLISEYMLAVVKAFSAKICKLPLALTGLDPQDYVANSESKRWVMENLHIDTKTLTFFSGMGQGMLFFYMRPSIVQAPVGGRDHESHKRDDGVHQGNAIDNLLFGRPD